MIHKTVEISDKASIGLGVKIWHYSQIREDAKIGNNCILGKNVYIDRGVIIGDNCKIQNNSSIYHGSKLSDGVFIGPNVCITNDKNPRAINPDEKLKMDEDWGSGKIVIGKGASIGAGSIVLTDVQIGKFAMIGAGSVVTKDVLDHTLVYGNPAKLKGYVCKCGFKAKELGKSDIRISLECTKCKQKIDVDIQ